MLRVGLWGSLADHVKSFTTTLDPFVFEVCQVTSEVEVARLDLLVYSKRDQESTNRRQLPKEIENNPIAYSWIRIPPPNQLEIALQDSLVEIYGFVVGSTNQVHVACRWIRSLAHQASAALDLRTLLVGETGTGKELIASAIHKLGTRRNEPFVAMNCAALPHDLIAAELFGHKRGAFTGAVEDRRGAFSAAGDGVVFLDEIGELPIETQTLLLRVLEKRKFSPIGSNESIDLKAQVISATNIFLADAVEKRNFRPDLYFRLAQITIELPPLRARRKDIPLLVRHFLKLNNKLPEDIQKLPMNELLNYEWPGNIRELRIAIERYILLTAVGGEVSPNDWLPASKQSAGSTMRGRGTLADLRNDFEKRVLRSVLSRCNGDTARAAEELGISRRSVYNLASRHGLELKEPGVKV